VVNAFLINVDKHEQQLRVPLGSLDGGKCPYTNYLGTYCKEDASKNFCDCALRENITVSISNEVKSTKKLPDKPPGNLPNETNFGYIDWLVNMRHIKPSYASLERENIPDHVGGQISFNWTDAATCWFEEALCKGERRIYAVKFDVGLMDDAKQAVPELVVFKSTNRSKDVTIKLEQREKGQLKPIATLKLICPSEDSCPVLITNVMNLPPDSDELCDKCEGSKKDGAHFQEYRLLTDDPFGVVPNRLCKPKNYADLPDKRPALCDALKSLPPEYVPRAAISNRVICPSAILSPD
jgi:hypothetical protein